MAQNQNKKWYFGNQAGLDFMTNPPTPLNNGAMLAQEGCASIADVSGSLLFYSDGVTVWNKLHQVMANGGGLSGNLSTSQSALFIKQPGNSNIYFLFTLDQGTWANGLQYSIIDISLAAGMGSVTAKNVPVASPCLEKLTATRHCNGNDIWIVSRDFPGNNFRANLLTSSGLNSSPVISSVGTAITGTSLTSMGFTLGYMKISPSGKKLGLAIMNVNAPIIELFDFDNSTGIVSNALVLKNGYAGYGCEFSPDGSKFYGNYNSPFDPPTRISQWDLCAGSDQAIIASEYTLSSSGVAAMQRATDGKIYIANSQSLQSLNVINNPNVAGPGCNYGNLGQSTFSPASVTMGLPNFIFEKLPLAPFTYSANTIVNCNALIFIPPPAPTITVTACTSVGYSLTNMVWDFGDPGSGIQNTSALTNPTHIYPGPGTYTAKLIYYYTCGGGTDTLTQQVTVGSVPVTSSSGFSVCTGKTLTLSVSSNVTYTWMTTPPVYTSSLVVSPAVNTSYTVFGTDANGCVSSSVQHVTVVPLPLLNVASSTNLCMGSVITLTANGANSYTWMTTPPVYTSSLVVSPAGNTSYTVFGTDANGCVSSSIQHVTVVPVPLISVAGSTNLCPGSILTLTANGANSYTWSTGATTPTINLNGSGGSNYTLTGSANGCLSQHVFSIAVYPLPNILITGNVPVCAGESVLLGASGANSFTWSTGSSASVLNITPPSNTIITLSGTSSNGCVGQQTTAINVYPLPAVSVSGGTTICSGAMIQLLASGANSYTWKPTGSTSGTGNLIFAPIATTIFSVTGTSADGCVGSATVLVIVNEAPVTQFSYPSLCVNSTGTVNPVKQTGFNEDGVFSSSELILDAQTGQINVSGLASGNYFVQYAVPGALCPSANSVAVLTVVSPSLNVVPTLVISPGSAAQLQASGGVEYSWSPSGELSCADCDNPVATPAESTRYCVTASVRGCTAQACTDVIVSCENANSFSVPNAFSPNGDGKNDRFCLQGWNKCVTAFNVVIYDRWGELVFQSSDYGFCWDGIYKGRELNSDVFVFVIRAEANNKVINKKGNITLIR